MGINVNFMRGTQARLDNLLALNATTAQFAEGTFYLTNDTNRLYFAQADNKLVDLNQYIHIWNGNSPPTTTDNQYLKSGDIYYLQGSNILAICNNPTQGTWVQLNPDTYLDANASNITFTNGTNSVTLALDVADSKGNHSQGSFTLTAGSNVQINQSSGNITISATDTTDNALYTLGTQQNGSQADVILNTSGVGGTTSSIAIKGSGSVTVTSTSAGVVTVSGSGGVSTVSNSFDAAGNFKTVLGTSDGDVSTDDSNTTLKPIIKYGASATNSAAFASGEATLSVYSIAEIDNLISNTMSAADAMTYKGTVNSSNATTKLGAASNGSTTACAGDTYKATNKFTYNGESVNVGDLLIAEGTDGNVTYAIVPSGDDQTITTSNSGNTFTISDTLGNSDLGSITINGTANGYGTIAVDSTSSGNALTLTVSHGAPGSGTAVTAVAVAGNTTQSLGTNFDIPIVTSISKDSAGHVTSVSASTYRFKDTHANISSVVISAASTTSTAAALTFTVTDTDSVSQYSAFNLTSNNLEITSTTADSVNIDLVWGAY